LARPALPPRGVGNARRSGSPRQGNPHVVDQYRAASVVSGTICTGKSGFDRFERLGRPPAAYRVLVITLGLSWLIFCIPVLAFYHVIPGANLPVEVFALASTLLVLLPTALWVTSITDGRAGVRALFGRVFGWRFGIGWWFVVLFGLPVITLCLGMMLGGSLHLAGLGPVLIKQLGSIALAVLVINLWEETVWAGFSKPASKADSTSWWPPF
jgi:hypothetical protein